MVFFKLVALSLTVGIPKPYMAEFQKVKNCVNWFSIGWDYLGICSTHFRSLWYQPFKKPDSNFQFLNGKYKMPEKLVPSFENRTFCQFFEWSGLWKSGQKTSGFQFFPKFWMFGFCIPTVFLLFCSFLFLCFLAVTLMFLCFFSCFVISSWLRLRPIFFRYYIFKDFNID